VPFKDSVNKTLLRATGYQLQKPGSQPRRRDRRRVARGDRLLSQPTFILSTVRSGSTLLRVLLNSHSQIHSPHEMHLRDMSVQIKEGYPEKALREVGLGEERLRHLLWDRVLHRELDEADKELLVNKTPSDVFIVDEILRCWRDARFIFLLRHPAAIAKSRHAARRQDSEARNAKMVARYGRALEDARRQHPGLTVRYEELTAEPERVTQEVCEFLGVPWEETMLDYGRHSHGSFRPGLGDWTENIKSGKIQPPKPLPSADEIPPQLVTLARDWGYLEADTALDTLSK
jgi:hypothetical protein